MSLHLPWRPSRRYCILILATALIGAVALGVSAQRGVQAQVPGPCDDDPNCGCFDGVECPAKYERVPYVNDYPTRTASLLTHHLEPVWKPISGCARSAHVLAASVRLAVTQRPRLRRPSLPARTRPRARQESGFPHRLLDNWGNAVQTTVTTTWLITATWRAESSPIGNPCPCDARVEYVTADVWWDDAQNKWRVQCTGCNQFYSFSNPTGASRIYQVDVCTTWDCFPNQEQSSTYELIVDVAERVFGCSPIVNDPPPVGTTPHHIWQVDFQTASVSDGRAMDESCELQGTVSPTSQRWLASDLGPRGPDSNYIFECPFDCRAIGPQLTISYQ